MKTLFFDSLGGASGDMILGALCGLGVDPAELEADLQTLPIDDFSISVEPFMSHSLQGVQAKVHVHEHHHHHGEGHGHHHHGRHLSQIKEMIEKSALPDSVKAGSIQVFERIAVAEAKMHGTTVEKIHFHEVGAMDSILDIVGSCLALHKLGVDQVAIRSLPVGCGTIQCAHGTIPCPAPATMELLQGFAIEQTDEPFEMVTPTGAALLSSWKMAERAPSESRPLKTAYSFGQRKLHNRPNLLRATLLESDSATEATTCFLLESNIDDMSPELTGILTECLREHALDVWTTPIQMKKQRPAIKVSVLCTAEQKSKASEAFFKNSTTFGIREQQVERHTLQREFKSAQTGFGPIKVKYGYLNGECITRTPEIADCEETAAKNGVSVRAVYEAALRAIK
ncbi:nickel pincer cofactor biosynthesis protein LarC [Verrucomicrobiota bacterium]